MDQSNDMDRALAITANAEKTRRNSLPAKSLGAASSRRGRRKSKSKTKERRGRSRRGQSKDGRSRSSHRSRGSSRRRRRRRLIKGVPKVKRVLSQSESPCQEGEASSVRILEKGESSLISCHVTELEITLYRSVPEDDKALPFFDTTVCLFREYGKQIDYAGVGRRMTNDRSLVHRTHDVVTVDASCKVSENFLEPAGGQKVVAGDTIVANMRKVSMCVGFSLCATLFTKGISLCEATCVYYAVRKVNERVPLAIIPLQVANTEHNSCIALMVRKRKNCSKATWELVRVGETIAQQDVKSVVKALQSRGLADPVDYTFDSLWPSNDSVTDHDCESVDSLDDCIDGDDQPLEKIAAPFSDSFAPDDLLRNVPRVKREGRRQYSVGRSAVNLFVTEGDSSDDDEVTEDALRAVVPKYTNTSPVRYDDKTYNIGSRSDQLTQHYVNCREEYGLIRAETFNSGDVNLPPIVYPTSAELRRFSIGEMGLLRPPVPPELSSTFPHLGRRRTTFHLRGTRLASISSNKRGRSRLKRNKRRGGKKVRSRSRSPSCRSRRHRGK